MSSSGLSDLSSPLSSDEDLGSTPSKGKTLDDYFKDALSTKPAPPPKKKRQPSPPHEYVLADNPDIALRRVQFLCMFRSRFNDAFPKSLPNYGPQDIEYGVSESVPSEQVERLLCALLGLVLNRKKDIERGHYNRALEEAVHAHTSQWSPKWGGKNPLHGGGNFKNMSPEQRLTLMSTLVLWSLGSSEAVQDIIKTMYKQQRQNDDRNQPLSVQPWGNDSDKRRYWLIEGRDDTPFRLYRESNPALKHITWRSVAGSIDDLKSVATKLDDDGSQASRRLRDSIQAAIPRFEAGEDKRRKREYRLSRKAQFTRPEPGFSLYEGRTRGKRIKYTFSDEEEGGSDALSTRRSNRHSGLSTPAEPARPTVTASGRQVRSRHGGTYGETILAEQRDRGPNSSLGGVNGTEDDGESRISTTQAGRATRKKRRQLRQQIGDYASTDGPDDETDVTSSGHEWDGGDEDEDGDDDHSEDDEEMKDDISEDELDADEGHRPQRSLVVSLRYPKSPPMPAASTPSEIPGSVTESNGISNQAPPPEANPFAKPAPFTTILSPVNGVSSTANGTVVNTEQHGIVRNSLTPSSETPQTVP
ncbi:MAG: hypothetical protein LQ341_001466 [Variospora aurantia]|nr:MAG: hypothetical protein LQ341_001466 [Variospora aurantia]